MMAKNASNELRLAMNLVKKMIRQTTDADTEEELDELWLLLSDIETLVAGQEDYLKASLKANLRIGKQSLTGFRSMAKRRRGDALYALVNGAESLGRAMVSGTALERLDVEISNSDLKRLSDLEERVKDAASDIE
jgi:hypothetical protein